MKTISQQLSEKTIKELSSSKLLYNPLKSTSRSWTDPEGYKYLIPWSNAVLLRFFIRRTTTDEYLQFIGYSQGSLEEVKEDVRELTEDKFLASKPGSSLAGIGINLGDFNKGLRKDKGKMKDFKGPLTSPNPPLNNFLVKDLIYEIFIELINKTDWLLQKLVESLEKKVSSNKLKKFLYD